MTMYRTLCTGVSRIMRPSQMFRKRENGAASKEMRAALRFSGLGLEPYQVALGAYFVASVLIGASLAVTVTLMLFVVPASLIPAGPLTWMLYVVIPTVVVPLAGLSLMANYPKMMAARMRNQSLGRLPEVIIYITMSMRLSPALDKAISFAAENVGEPMATQLRRVLWHLHLRRYHSIEEAFLDFSYEWGDWNEDFKRSLYAIRGAVLERTEEGLGRGLDKATDIIMSGTKQRMEAYVAKLSGPTFVFFTVGIVLPMVFGAMLPMMSIGGMSVGSLQIVLLMNVLFPTVTFLYALSVLTGRPGTSTPPDVGTVRPGESRSAALKGLIAAVAVSLLVVPPVSGLHPFGLLPLLWAVGAGVSIYCLDTALARKKARDRLVRMEDEFPDALFQLGSRISEGKPLERALTMTSESMKATEISKLFKRISNRLHLTRSTLGEVLFERNGVLVDLPSQTIRATMRTVNELVKKDVREAGKTIIGIGQYLRDMRKVDHEVRTKLDGVLDMMRTTGVFFAPLIMGVTAALYTMMEGVMSDVDIGSLGAFSLGTSGAVFMDPVWFTMVMGTYLMMAVGIILYFVAGMRSPGDAVELKVQIGTALPVAVLIFTLSTWAGVLMA